MHPLISPSLYSDEEQFKKEQIFISQNQWNFAGFATALINHHDYITTKIGNLSIIIQNFQGNLQAFTNVCSHRFSQIFSQPQGNGPLQCPFHGWLYDREGIPVGIPHLSGFDDLTEDAKESLKLERWLVDKCGDLVFVKRRDGGPNLKEFLGQNYETLKEFSAAMNEQIHYSEMTIRANWKICVENGLEGYHVPYVHNQSFGKPGDFEEAFGGDRYHSYYSRKSLKTTKKRFEKLVEIAAENQIKFDRYYHYLIFPTLVISTMYGLLFILSKIQPISAGETKIIKYMFARKLPDKSSEGDLESLQKFYTGFAAKVWQEDKDICEQVHLGMLSVDRQLPGILHREEKRIYQFHRAYLDAMSYS